MEVGLRTSSVPVAVLMSEENVNGHGDGVQFAVMAISADCTPTAEKALSMNPLRS